MIKYTAPEMEITVIETADILMSTENKGDEGEVITPGLGGR